MPDFKSNLRACLSAMMPYLMGVGVALGFVGYCAAVMWVLVVTLDVHIITAYIVAALSLPFLCAFACAAWKTWGRDWYARWVQ
jgi:hypothetical protein